MSLKHVHLFTVSPSNYISNFFEKLLKIFKFYSSLGYITTKIFNAHIVMEILKTIFQ